MVKQRNSQKIEIDNPYENINWDTCQYIHSMSHQHSLGNAEECSEFYQMGYRHFAFSCYYPSKPIPSLPESFAANHPNVAFSPNAEHHSFTDSNLHCNGLGSTFSSGYGQTTTPSQRENPPIIAVFDKLNPSENHAQPDNIYRLDITIEATKNTTKFATLTVEGAVKYDRENESAAAQIRDFPLAVGAHQILLQAQKSEMTVTLDYDKSTFSVRQFRLMQGTNRPWRDVFRDILANLQYRNGGGITLNHPGYEAAHYLPMLDFDERVLGVEVWNYRRGFGNSQHYYQVWDDILRTGRRCWGFFVKDHRAFERGRNVLLLPTHEKNSSKNALRAYRNGAFFGAVAASAADNAGNMISPFDKSTFRFTKIAIQRDENGVPQSLQVNVAGQDFAKRPNVQIRFITAKGIAQITDAPTAEFPLKMRDAEFSEHQYIRVEAFAYPDSYGDKIPLDKSTFSAMDVAQIAALENNRNAETKQKSAPPEVAANIATPWNTIGCPPQFRNPVPVADMIFSQPIRFVAR